MVSTENIEGIKKKYEHKIFFSGYLIRKEILDLKEKESKITEKELSILIMGGSQSAKVFAEQLPEVIKKCSDNGIRFNIYQQCLDNQKNELNKIYNELNLKFELFSFAKDLSKYLYDVPQADKLFKKTRKLLSDRKKMVEETENLDWAMGELLAYASLLDEGHNVRLSGQDVERGTFSHRHAILKVEHSEEEVCPLNNISDSSSFEAYNSLLSEYGVLGFDYGFSMARPNDLTIWEAQFGDFSNGAQIMLDQFISCAEDKWKVMSGLVMLLPHGYEGQGAEHSSARLERYLQLCAKNNMQIVNCTTPANFYHVLRRQLKRDYRKPLVVFTPKSLLRHPKCVSTIADLADGKFEGIIDDTIDPTLVDRLVLCSGKIYYELLERRKQDTAHNVAIVRLEQLFPLEKVYIKELVEQYNAEEVVWVQEEPENMGAWTFILSELRSLEIDVIARESSAATATGSSKTSAVEHKELIDKVFKK